MAFQGFGEHVVDFYDGLTADNSKPYWEDNKHIYLSDIRKPMQELLAELEPEFGEFGEAKIFRPYRDVRFTKEKHPYKNHCGAVIEQGRGAGAYYVQVSADGLLVGGGMFNLAPDQLARYRTAVDDDRRGQALEKILAVLRKGGWEVTGDQMKTKPRNYSADHPRIGLLRHRSLYVVSRWAPDDALHERETLIKVRNGWRALRRFNEWAADHVGASAG